MGKKALFAAALAAGAAAVVSNAVLNDTLRRRRRTKTRCRTMKKPVRQQYGSRNMPSASRTAIPKICASLHGSFRTKATAMPSSATATAAAQNACATAASRFMTSDLTF